jgi:hypothetical protein
MSKIVQLKSGLPSGGFKTGADACAELGAAVVSNGFEDMTKVSLQYSYPSTLTVTHLEGSAVWVKGLRYSKLGVESLTHSTGEGSHFIYYNASGVLTSSFGPTISSVKWDYLNTTPVALCLKSNQVIDNRCADARRPARGIHDLKRASDMDSGTACKKASGFEIADYLIGVSSSDGLIYSISPGITSYGDKLESYSGKSTSDSIYSWALNGVDAAWNYSVNVYGFRVSPIQYNTFSGGSWTTVNVPVGYFVNYYVVALPMVLSSMRIGTIVGRQIYSTLAEAVAEDKSSVMPGMRAFDSPVFLYKITYERTAAAGLYYTRIMNVHKFMTSAEHQDPLTTGKHIAESVSHTSRTLPLNKTAELGSAINKLGETAKFSLNLNINDPYEKTYYFTLSAKVAFKINALTVKTGRGSVVLKIQVNGVDVPTSTTTATMSISEKTFTTGNTVNAGDRVMLVITSISGKDLVAEIHGEVV